MKKFIILVILLLLSAPAFSATALIENYTPEELKNALVKIAVRRGAEIKNANEYSLVTDMRGSFWSDVFFGSGFNPYTQIRITYGFVGDGKNTIMNVNCALITNPGSAFERPYPLEEKRNTEIAQYLQNAFNGYYGFGIVYKKHRNYAEIRDFEINNIDLHTGDKILAVNGRKIKDFSKKELKKQFEAFQKGEILKLEINSNNDKKELVVKSYFIPPVVVKDKL